MNLCGAITYNGNTCKRVATHNGRCRWHGGLISKFNWQDTQSSQGRKWSNVLPDYLVARYEDTASNPSRLSVQDEIALLDARIEDILSRISHGENGSAWDDLNEAYAQMLDAIEYGRYEEERSCRIKIGNIIMDAVDASSAWVNIQSLIEQRRRLVECEQRSAIIASAHRRQADAEAVIEAYTVAIRQHVSDPDLCNTIHAEVEKLLND